jgi:hypothetical protein
MSGLAPPAWGFRALLARTLLNQRLMPLLAIKNPRRGVDLQDETFSTQISFATRDLLF